MERLLQEGEARLQQWRQGGGGRAGPFSWQCAAAGEPSDLASQSSAKFSKLGAVLQCCLQSKIMNIRLLDYVHCNTEIVTCIPSDYGITYIVIQKLKLVFPGITELQDYTHFGRLQSQIMNIR